ncbi:unnamed protein product, partial [Rotaria magnacalcarata]
SLFSELASLKIAETWYSNTRYLA